MDTIKAESEDGPWERLDPEKLMREAELKEQKIARRKEQTALRAEARRLRRQEKSEAKQTRKANVKRAAKWTEERRALDKLKKIANKPRKDERKRQRMLKRADKLEEQAKKLHIEAQKARARFAYLTKIKEEEEAVKAQILAEREKEQKTETDDYIPLGGDADEEAEATELVVKAKPTEKLSAFTSLLVKPAANSIPKQTTATSVATKPELVPVDEPMVNSQRMHLVPGARDALKKASLTNGNVTASTEKTTKEMKQPKSLERASERASTDSAILDSPITSKKDKKDKKDKKRKRKESAEVGEEQTNDVSGSLEESQPKKAKKAKKLKHSHEAAEEAANGHVIPAAGEGVIDSSKKEKKEKKDKKAKKDKKVKKEAGSDSYNAAQPTDSQDAKADEAAQWDVAGVSGGAKRQSKFLKLLGGEKNGISVGAATAKQGDRANRAAVEEELERQFEEGMLAKEERQRGGKRLGLGA